MSLFHRLLGRDKTRIYHLDPEDVFLDSTNIADLNLHQMEGQLERPLSPYISNALIFLVVIIFGAFSYRLFSMQITSGDAYKEKAMNNYVRSTPIFAHRGTISDRNGILLAWNEKDNDNTASSTEDIPRRVYTSEPGFSHILGYVSYPKKDSSGIFWQDEYIGKDGVEKEYQSKLQGMAGQKYITVTAAHSVESENIATDPIDGENLKLTIDSGVQKKLYESMVTLASRVGFTGGAGVIIDIKTGEILALTSYPEYNNNLITNASTSEEKDKVAHDLLSKSNKFLNRAIGGLFTPGSTVKPYIAYSALTEGVITPEKQILSTGALVIKNKYGGPDSIFRDWKVHGWIDMRQAIAESSDEYFYQVGGGFGSQAGLGIAKIDKYARLFGFASSTGIDLPGENSGVIPTPEWKKKIFNEDWILGDTYHTSIGQYGFQITPVELARAVAAIANGGKLVTPHVLIGAPAPLTDLNLDQSNLKVVQEGMRRAVEPGNTVQVLNIDGVKVAGKSGTAELGVSKELVNSWISGYFPYDNPRYAFAVIMEKGSRNNLTGAVFVMRDVLEYLRDYTNYTK